MKYFLVGSKAGAPVYFDVPTGRMSIPPMVIMQELMEENFQERSLYMCAGRVLLVTAKWQDFLFCVVSDEGDAEIFLRAQLYAIYRLFAMTFGPSALRTYQSPFFLKNRAHLQRLVDMSSHYFSNNQSFLVRAAEQVDVNKDLVRQVRSELQKVFKTLPNATHAVLLVGTKILATFTKAEYAELNPQDVFLMVLYARAEFHPIDRALVQEDLPQAADYTDHANPGAATQRADDGANSNNNNNNNVNSGGGFWSTPPPSSESFAMNADDSVDGTGLDTTDASMEDLLGDGDSTSVEAPVRPELAPALPAKVADYLQSTLEAFHAAFVERHSQLQRDAHVGGAEVFDTVSVSPDTITESSNASSEGTMGVSKPSKPESSGSSSSSVSTTSTIRVVGSPSTARGELRKSSNGGVTTRMIKLPGEMDSRDQESTEGSSLKRPLFSWGAEHRSDVVVDAANWIFGRHSTHRGTVSPAPESEPEVALLLQYALWKTGFFSGALDALFGSPLQSALTAFQKSQEMNESGEADIDTVLRLLGFVASGQTIRDKKPISGGASGAAGVDGAQAGRAPLNLKRSLRNLWLRVKTLKAAAAQKQATPTDDPFYTECRVSFAELEPALVLVIVSTAAAKKDPDEVAKLERVEGYLKSRKSLGPYFSFFVTKEHTHLSMLSYVHQFPGLVHFIVVDRTLHRVIAPSICALSGQKHADNSPEFIEQQVKMIKRNVWKMCSVAQHLLTMGGHTSSVVKQSDFIYCYELWVEDQDGVRVPIEGPLQGAQDLSLDTNYYSAMMAKQFPERKGLRCFELYSMFLGSLSTSTLKKYNELLLFALRQHFPVYFGVAK